MLRTLRSVVYKWVQGLLVLMGIVSAPPPLRAEKVEYEGALYHLHRVSVSDQPRLQLRWLGVDGNPLGSFSGLLKEVAQEGRHLAFATNAGIYEKGPKPCGLTICQGQELVPLNLSPGEGNFYLQPNGVFYLDDQKGAGVMESVAFSKSGLKPRLATQSGPMLLSQGRMHPAFKKDSVNRRLRNAVGVRKADGQIIFVMSDREDSTVGRVTFHQLSSFFLHLGCQEALFLDGDLSDMLVRPPVGITVRPNTFAAMFLMVE